MAKQVAIEARAVLLAAVALIILPVVFQQFGNAWVRIVDIALLYVLLALGLNIVVGYAGCSTRLRGLLRGRGLACSACSPRRT